MTCRLRIQVDISGPLHQLALRSTACYSLVSILQSANPLVSMLQPAVPC